MLMELAPHAELCTLDYPPEVGAIIHLMRKQELLTPSALTLLKDTYQEAKR